MSVTPSESCDLKRNSLHYKVTAIHCKCCRKHCGETGYMVMQSLGFLLVISDCATCMSCELQLQTLWCQTWLN